MDIPTVPGILDWASSSDVAKRFGHFHDEAMRHPLAVERDDAMGVVMISAAE